MRGSNSKGNDYKISIVRLNKLMVGLLSNKLVQLRGVRPLGTGGGPTGSDDGGVPTLEGTG